MSSLHRTDLPARRHCTHPNHRGQRWLLAHNFRIRLDNLHSWCRTCTRLHKRSKRPKRVLLTDEERRQRHRDSQRRYRQSAKGKAYYREWSTFKRRERGIPVSTPRTKPYRAGIRQSPKLPAEPLMAWLDLPEIVRISQEANLDSRLPSEARSLRAVRDGERDWLRLAHVDAILIELGQPHMLGELYPDMEDK